MVQSAMNKIRAAKWPDVSRGMLSVKENLYLEDIFEVNLKFKVRNV